MASKILAGGLLAALALPAPLLAQETQTASTGLPLSQIIAALEAQPDFARIESVEWDDGRWEIEYDRADGSEVEVDIDPATGEPIRR